MTAFDYTRLGELRIRAERAEAQRDRLAEAGDQLATMLLRLSAGIEFDYVNEWREARAWDGAPATPPGTIGAPMSRRKGHQG